MKKFSLFISVLFLLAFMSSAFAGSISGRVTTTGDEGIEGIEVTAYSTRCWGSEPAGYVWTDPAGDYVIGGLDDGGSYYVVSNCCGEPNPPSIHYTSEWYGSGGGGTIDCEQAITVSGDATGINFQLDPAGTISGTIYDESDGTPITGVQFEVWAFQAEKKRGQVSTFDICPKRGQATFYMG